MKKWIVSAVVVASLGGGSYSAVEWYRDVDYRRDCIEHSFDGDKCMGGPAGWAKQRCLGVDRKGRPAAGGVQKPPGYADLGQGNCVRAWLAHGK